jgi:flagellar motor switch protein FliG
MVIQDGIRKTAILIDSVDQPTAEILFRQISFELAGQVRTALLELGDVDPAEREQILAEFLDAGFGPTPEILEAEFGQAANLPATQETAEGPAVSGFPVDNDPHDVEPELPQIEAPTAALARGLAQEHAQTICLVLANLPSPQAADLMQRLPPARQAEVLKRLAQLEATAPEVLHDLSEELQPWGLSAAELMPNAWGRSPRSESGLLAPCLNDAPPRQAGETPPLAEFDDLVRLDDAALARVFGAAAPEIVLLALSGANRDLIDRIVCRLPASAGRTLRRQLETLGPTRLRDIEAAQQQLAELAGQMCRDGLIHLPSRRRFTMAA